MKARIDSYAQVKHNRIVHDAVALAYETHHVEIYNPTEQARIAHSLRTAIEALTLVEVRPRVLDFGAGTGNLTTHLLDLGAYVVAADVSAVSLATLRMKHLDNEFLETAELNGIDLSSFPDDSFDMVATYSVLHHVPDYLAAVKEFVRVVRPGGVIYIDHEVAPVFWNRQDDCYARYLNTIQQTYGPSRVDRLAKKLRNLFSISSWKRLLNRHFLGLNEEGDIHVTKDDHIDWLSIEAVLRTKCEVVLCSDFLICREPSSARPVHRQYENQCVDMRFVIARKK